MAEKEDWTLTVTEEEDGAKMWHTRNSQPPNADEYPTVVIIEWRYAEHGPPDKTTLAQLHSFDELVEPLGDPAVSAQATTITGGGCREWCYYAKTYDGFMLKLNQLLSGQPRFPLSIEYNQDPEWNYWAEIKSILSEDNSG